VKANARETALLAKSQANLLQHQGLSIFFALSWLGVEEDCNMLVLLQVKANVLSSGLQQNNDGRTW